MPRRRPPTGGKKLRCPVCRKPLTEEEFEKATGIWKSKKEHIQHLEREARSLRVAKASLERKKERLERREKELRPLIERQIRREYRPLVKQKAQEAANAAREAERGRASRLLAGKEKDITRLRQRLRQVQKGTTPQTEGFDYEENLVQALKRAFPKDEIKHVGKDGDILHTVRFERKSIGLIVYECKRVPKVRSPHIEQARRAKTSRGGDFGVLVTSGKLKGFDGLGSQSGVVIVSPQGAIPLASLLRNSLIEMAKAKFIQSKKALVAQRLVDHITSPQFKNPLQDVIHRTKDLGESIQEEAKEHVKTWQRRWLHYQVIWAQATGVQRNMELILQGKQPEPIRALKPPPLALPASTK